MKNNCKRQFKYDLGIIGGMGSEATVEIYRRIINKTLNTCDQDHMRICILNNSIIPDRTEYILYGKENPLPYLNESIKELESLNVRYFIVPCNTAHYLANKFQYSKIGFISMIEESLNKINELYKNEAVCVLSTTGTAKTRVYHDHELAKNINFVYPIDNEQEIIMSVINDTKKGVNKETLANRLINVVNDIIERNGKVVFLIACTELSLYSKYIKKLSTVLDAMDCLVESSIIKCDYEIKN